MRRSITTTLVTLCASLVFAGACGGDDDEGSGGSGGGGGSPDNTGSECETPADCYPGVDPATLLGEVQCLDRVDDGYCTHLCQNDADCCAVDGECKTNLKQVCSPFESTGLMMCFLSCEDADLVGPDGGPAVDENEYCQREASPDFICRSSGGGAQNRMICVPGDCDVGEDCSADADCASGLVCETGFKGGYCTRKGCTANADCPNGSLCVDRGGTGYCLKACIADSDCSFCRAWDVRATCSPDVTYVEATTSGSVCVPPA